MPKESPYRARGRPRSQPRSLAFFHARFTVLVVVVLVILGASLGAIDAPHDLELRCTPSSEPRVDCVSSVKRPLRGAETKRVSLTPDEIESSMFLVPEEHEPPSFEDLDASMSWRDFHHAMCWDVVLSWGGAQKTVHEDCSYSHAEQPYLGAFQRALKQGEPAVVRYRSGWGGFGVAIPLILVTLFFLWLGSGRTRVQFDPESGEVVVHSRAFWRMKAEQQRFARSNIAEVILFASTLESGAKILRPAFRDNAGHVTALGSMGLAPERSAHFVKLLRGMLADSDLDGG